MKKIETLFVGTCLVVALVATGAVIWQTTSSATRTPQTSFPTTKYGAFLAAQHAIYVNDFDSAAEFTKNLTGIDYALVSNTRMIAEFLSGKMPDNIAILKNEKSMPAALIYDAHLVNTDAWDELYKRHKKDSSALSAPLRVWSAIETGHSADAIKFIDTLQTNASWKSFVRGQIYAHTGDTARAAAEFAAVSPDFMNINDYIYIMSFYMAHDMNDAADALRRDFTTRPGGMYMLGFEKIPDRSNYSGSKNALAFSLVQAVSHTQIMMYSDLAILLLRFAQITGPAYTAENDAINYYMGQYFFNNAGNWQRHFDAIDSASPYYLFAVMRRAEKTDDIEALDKAVRKNPLFVPAAAKLVAHHTAHGDQRAALRVISRALDAENIPDAGRAYFTKLRAQVNFAFGDIEVAQKDLRAASNILPIDADILSLQAKIWAVQNRELDNAYEYAMTLVKQNPTDIIAWDTLGAVVAVRDGADAAMDVLVRVGEVANTCSSLYERLGDLYLQTGDKKLARDAYMRAIELSDDGLTVAPRLEKKVRNIK